MAGEGGGNTQGRRWPSPTRIRRGRLPHPDLGAPPPPMADLTVTALPRDNDDLDGDDDGPGGGSRVSGDLFCDFLFS